MLLRRGHERLHDVDVALAAVGERLRLQAVVAEPFDVDGGPGHPEVGADPVGQGGVRRAAEHDDIVHFETIPHETRVRSQTIRPFPVARAGQPTGRASARAAPPTRVAPGKAHEAVRDARVVGVPDLDPGLAQRLGVGRALVAERVEVGRLHERRGQPAQVVGVQR